MRSGARLVLATPARPAYFLPLGFQLSTSAFAVNGFLGLPQFLNIRSRPKSNPSPVSELQLWRLHGIGANPSLESCSVNADYLRCFVRR
jgi:hypothetical protein